MLGQKFYFLILQIHKDVDPTRTHEEFKNEFYNFKVSSYKESTLNFAPKMF